MTMGGDPIIFPDAVASIITLFANAPQLTGVAVHQVEPNPLPAGAFILVRRFGGHMRNPVIDDAYVTIEAWAPTEAESHDLAQLARAVLYASVGTWMAPGVFSYRVDEIGGISMSPDPETAHPRYLWTSSVSLRGGPAL